MKRLCYATAAAVALAALLPSASADDIDKKTRITVSESIQIPGRILPPGTYVLKRGDPFSNHDLVRVYNDREDRLEATIMAISDFRVNRTGKVVLEFWETPDGAPPALKAWFFAGEQDGEEFAYPKWMADELSRGNGNAKVPVDDRPLPDVSQVNKGTLPGANRQPADVSARSTAVAPRTSSALIAQAAPLPAASSEVAAPAVPETLLAQNDPQATPAAPKTDSDAKLPATATFTGLVVVVGFMSLLGAALLRFGRV